MEGVLAVVCRMNSFICHHPIREGRVRRGCVWVAGQEQGELGGRKTSLKCFKEGPGLGQTQRRWAEGASFEKFVRGSVLW